MIHVMTHSHPCLSYDIIIPADVFVPSVTEVTRGSNNKLNSLLVFVIMEHVK